MCKYTRTSWENGDVCFHLVMNLYGIDSVFTVDRSEKRIHISSRSSFKIKSVLMNICNPFPYTLLHFAGVGDNKRNTYKYTAKLCTIIYLSATMLCTGHAVHKNVKNMACRASVRLSVHPRYVVSALRFLFVDQLISNLHTSNILGISSLSSKLWEWRPFLRCLPKYIKISKCYNLNINFLCNWEHWSTSKLFMCFGDHIENSCCNGRHF
jgi:hypothetical protein